MTVLTFLTAPWSVGTPFRFFRGRENAFPALLAVVCWMFSTSWSYDLYLLLKQGLYPPTWAATIAASSMLYVIGGFFWNLRWTPVEGATFSFMHAGWPTKEDKVSVLRLLPWDLPFMLIFGGMIGYFLWTNGSHFTR